MEALIFSKTSVNSFQVTEAHVQVDHIFLFTTARTSNPKVLISDLKKVLELNKCN
jgi:hypothetical protein